jgi:hypothetical protein
MTGSEAIVSSRQAAESTLILPLDAEHTGIRTVGCFAFLVFVPVSYILFSLLVTDIPVLAGVISVPVGVGISYLIEQMLRKRWPSGRTLHASPTSLTMLRNAQVQAAVDPAQTANLLTWHFTVPRNGRVKKGWKVIALAVEQDENIIPLYTFASPADFENMPFSERFIKLERKKESDDKVARSASSMRIAGQQRRLYEAEQHRGMTGGELTFEQFKQFLQYLHENYPEWLNS